MTPTTPNYSIGSLVSARGREWMVLPGSSAELLILKPLGGSDDEITGILTALEPIRPASFALPDPTQIGDYMSGKLLRDALRLGFRNSAGPFRSFGRLAFDPRPYQLVPLIMALKQDPVRLLIADDVGIGKTIEALLIARELLDRGEIRRFCVLTPPHLAEQWQRELSAKFHLDAELVLPHTVKRLERNCRQNESIFDVYPFTVASIDYLKTDRHSEEFLRTAPELIIVDEAHSASHDTTQRSACHQRHALLQRLAQDSSRHLILATATPHSGNEAAFRSLLSLLNQDFTELPAQLSGSENVELRRRIARHFIQRRRPDIQHYLEETEFPTSESLEAYYTLSQPYRELFQEALAYAREIVSSPFESGHRQRVRWWSALALLRALASSPVAAASTLRNRSATLGTTSIPEADELGRRQVMDLETTDSTDASDFLPGSVSYSEADEDARSRRRLKSMAQKAEALAGAQDAKLISLIPRLNQILAENYSPIIFCRFIQTAEYLAEELRRRLPNRYQIVAITGMLPPEEREARVEELARHPHRILVATDCLSEGINLQEHFDAVIHYDLSWNPTRHEQREGRVDRFGQPRRQLKMLTYYGIDNQIDGIVLDVLLRKHKTIKHDLGISVSVPADTDAILEAVFEGFLLREDSGSGEQLLIAGFDEFFSQSKSELHGLWEHAKEQEKRSRTMYAQEGLSARIHEIKAELDSVRESIGSQQDLQRFVRHSLLRYGAQIREQNGALTIDLSPLPLLIKESLGDLPPQATFRFSLPAPDKEIYLCRTHPFVEALADLILNSALDPISLEPIASRAGVIRSNQLDTRHTLLLLRHRFHLSQMLQGSPHRSLIEDSQLVAFRGSPENPQWLSEAEALALLDIQPTENIIPQVAEAQISQVISAYPALLPQLNHFAQTRAQKLAESHLRVRDASLIKGGAKPEIKPELPADLLGIYVYLPCTQIGAN